MGQAQVSLSSSPFLPSNSAGLLFAGPACPESEAQPPTLPSGPISSPSGPPPSCPSPGPTPHPATQQEETLRLPLLTAPPARSPSPPITSLASGSPQSTPHSPSPMTHPRSLIHDIATILLRNLPAASPSASASSPPSEATPGVFTSLLRDQMSGVTPTIHSALLSQPTPVAILTSPPQVHLDFRPRRHNRASTFPSSFPGSPARSPSPPGSPFREPLRPRSPSPKRATKARPRRSRSRSRLPIPPRSKSAKAPRVPRSSRAPAPRRQTDPKSHESLLSQ